MLFKLDTFIVAFMFSSSSIIIDEESEVAIDERLLESFMDWGLLVALPSTFLLYSSELMTTISGCSIFTYADPLSIAIFFFF
jgi:hypothetical protein